MSDGIGLGINLWSQASDWPAFLRAAQRAEELGFDHLWTWDHLLAIFGDPDQPIFEGYAALAAVAATTSRIRVGLFVGANTFRKPGLAVKAITTIDHISGGRAVMGIGGAWFEGEHQAFGLDFGSGYGQRLDWLAEAVPAMRALLDGEEVTSAPGGHYAFDRPADQPAAAPAPPADHDRRGPASGRRCASSRSTPTSGTRSGRPRSSPTRTPCCGRTAPTSGATRRRSSARSAARSRSAPPRRRPSASVGRCSSTTGRRSRTSTATRPSGPGRPSRSPRRWSRTGAIGFHTFIVELGGAVRRRDDGDARAGGEADGRERAAPGLGPPRASDRAAEPAP